MIPPRFHDQGIRFTVRVPNDVVLAPDDLAWLSDRTPPTGLSEAQRHALVAMRHGTTWSNKSLREAYPMVSAGLAEAVGAGSTRTYRLATPNPPNAPAPAGGSTKSPTPSRRPYTSRQDNAQALLAILTQEGAATLAELRVKSGLTARQVQYAMQLLREVGSVELLGGRGARSLYSAHPGLPADQQGRAAP
jgi:ATP-dependent DNA helicase RecG